MPALDPLRRVVRVGATWLGLVLVSTLVFGCTSESTPDAQDAATVEQVPVEASPAPEQAVYDPVLIMELLNTVPAEKDWKSVHAHIHRINKLASLGPGVSLDATLSPTVNQEMAEVTLAAYEQALGLWGFLGATDPPVVWNLMSEQDWEWWATRVKELEGPDADLSVWNPQTNLFGHCLLTPSAFCGYGSTSRGGDMGFQYNVIGSQYSGVPNRNTVHHEAAHLYHFSYPSSDNAALPCWFIEGQATIFGNAVSPVPNSGYYGTDEKSFDRFGYKTFPGDSTWDVDRWVSELDNYAYSAPDMSRCHEQEINYSLGAAIFEHLYGTYTIMEIHELFLAMGIHQDWDAATRETLGLSASQLHTEIAQYLVSLHSTS